MTAGAATGPLEEAARRIRGHAYAPYSGYHVGAALLADDGRTFVGVNVESASYPLTTCAERGAVMAAMAAGARRFTAIAVATASSPPAAPCGGCRQVLREFGPDLLVVAVNDAGERRSWVLRELLPDAFAPDTVGADLPRGGG